VVSAAEKAAHAEDTAIFNGFNAGGIEGIIPSSPHPAITIPDDYADYPSIVGDAVETLRRGGITGPMRWHLDRTATRDWLRPRRMATRSASGRALPRRADGAGTKRSTGAVLLSHRGGDFQLSVGQDLSVGYAGHDKDTVHLYLTESFAFRVLDRAAAMYLKPKRGKK